MNTVDEAMNQKTFFLLLCICLALSTKAFASTLAPLNGTYAIPGDFATINDAAISLNTNGISGPVVFNVAAGHSETAPAGSATPGGILFGVITGTSSVNTITFQKAGAGANPIVFAGANHTAGGVLDAVIRIVGTDYLIFDSINLSENPANTTWATTATNNMTEFGFGFFYSGAATAGNGAQNNTIRNCTITLNTSGTNYPNTFGIYSTTLTSAINAATLASVTTFAGSNSNNKLYGNSILNANFGITITGSNTPVAMDTGWDIGGNSATTGNTITNFGQGNGVAPYTYQKIGTSVQGILVNQVAAHSIAYNTLQSTNGTLTTAATLCGIVLGYTGAMVQPNANTSQCNNNSITLINGISDNTYGIWSRIGNATSVKTISNNTIRIENIALTQVTSKITAGIFQDAATGDFTVSSNTIRIHYENSNSDHAVFFIRQDVTNGIRRIINNNILETPAGKSLRTSWIVNGISHNGISSGPVEINGNFITINKGNVSSTAVFSGINSSAASTSSSYSIESNQIALTCSTTSNAVTTISGINNNDGTSSVTKSLRFNSISINGSNTGGTSVGILVGKSGPATVTQNQVTIVNHSSILQGILLTVGCTSNTVSNNTINCTAPQIANNISILGIFNTAGTLTATTNDIVIAMNTAGTVGYTATTVGIENTAAGGTITNNTRVHISGQSTFSGINVGMVITCIRSTGANSVISGNNDLDIAAALALGSVNAYGIVATGANSTVSTNLNITCLVTASGNNSTVYGIQNSGTGTIITGNNLIDVRLTSRDGGYVYSIVNSGISAQITQNNNLIAIVNATYGIAKSSSFYNTGINATIDSNLNETTEAYCTFEQTITQCIFSSVAAVISNNTLNSTSVAGTLSSAYGVFSTGSVSGNVISVVSNAQTGIDSSAGIHTNANSTVSNNNITTNFVSASGSVLSYGINASGQNTTVSGNTIDHYTASNGNQATLAWTSWIFGIRSYGINNSIQNNSINRVYGAMGRGTTIFEIAGIFLEASENALVDNNLIKNVSSNGTVDNRTYLSGIYVYTDSYNITIRNNRIFDISLNNNVTGVHPGPGIVTGQPVPANTNGIWVRMSFNTLLHTIKIYNNHISKLYNPSASSLGGLFGLCLSSRETNYLVYHNTITLGDKNNQITSNITGNFGATAVGYLNRVGTGTTDLRNNILYVNVLPKSSGYVAALSAIKNHDLDLSTFFTNPGQTSVRPPNYGTSSNNNLFFAPSVHNRRSYFYCEGDGFGTEYNRYNIDHNTVAIYDPNMNVNPFSGCTSKYKTLMNGGASNYGTDNVSFYDDIVLTEGTAADAGYWTPSGETYAESGAQVLGGEYDLDSKGVSRGSNPDMGALQFSGNSETVPDISYSPLTVPGSCGAVVSSLTLSNVHIIDEAGVPVSGNLVPRLYYQMNSGAYTSVAGTLTSGNGNDGYWSFNLTGLSAGILNYYVIAQDRLTQITSNPATGLLACNVNNVTTHPTSPSTLTIGGSVAVYALGAWSNTPQISRAVIFDDDYNSVQNIEACSVLVKSGRTVVFNSAHHLLVQHEVVVEPGATLLFENNSSLVQIEPDANSGNIIYKRIANVKRYDYVYWSSPVDGFALNNLNALPTMAKYKWEPTAANTNGGLGNWVNATGNIMTTGRGYITMSPASFSTSIASPFEASFIGIPTNGDITYPVSRGAMTTTTLSSYTSANGIPFTEFDDNWNLIGNPYPSSISANHFLYNNRVAAGGALNGFIKIWTHGIDPLLGATNPFYGSYLYNYNPNDYITYNILGASCCPSVGDYKIGAGQGFFVQMTEGNAASSTVTFNNAMRRDGAGVVQDNTQFYRNSENDYYPSPEKHRIWLDLVNMEANSDRMLLGYIEGATNGYDTYFDVPCGYEQVLNIYSLTDNLFTKTQGRSLPFSDEDYVPLGYFAPVGGSYKIALAAVDGLFTTQSIYVEDLKTGLIHNLKQSPYSFSTDNGRVNTRFRLIFKNETLANETISYDSSIKITSNSNTIHIQSLAVPLEKIVIFDTWGRTVFSKDKINHAYAEIELDNNQFYLLEIYTADGSKTLKKIITR